MKCEILPLSLTIDIPVYNQIVAVCSAAHSSDSKRLHLEGRSNTLLALKAGEKMGVNKVRSGILYAIAAYSMWGVAPVYFKQIALIPATEILVHRIFWSVAVLVIFVIATGQYAKVKRALANKKVVQLLLLSGILLAGNWLLFIWAVNSGHILDASLGYYINPLLNVFLGRMFFAERLRKLQQWAVGLAIVGVSVLVVSYGQVPWIALILAGSFAIYGLLRKQAAVDSLPGLFIETSMMLPFALIYWAAFGGASFNLYENEPLINLLLISGGIITTVPLLCFTAAAKRIMYSTLGFFQYIGPTIMFGIAVFLYDEPLSDARLLTFIFVWLALCLFSFDSYRSYRTKINGEI